MKNDIMKLDFLRIDPESETTLNISIFKKIRYDIYYINNITFLYDLMYNFRIENNIISIKLLKQYGCSLLK